MQRRFLSFYVLGGILAFCGYVIYDYYNSFSLVGATLVKILDDKEKPDRQVLVFATLSTYPARFFIPHKVRYFFYVQPRLCFVQPDGTELVDEYLGYSCFNEADHSDKKQKSHEMEKSEFTIPFYKTPNDFDKTQLLYKTIMRQRGIWVKLMLMGYMFPPPVDSKPVFVSFEPYCKTRPEQCHRIFGW